MPEPRAILPPAASPEMIAFAREIEAVIAAMPEAAADAIFEATCPFHRSLPPCDGAQTAAERSWRVLPEDACGSGGLWGAWCAGVADDRP